MRVLWIVVAIFAAIGALVFVAYLSAAETVMQEASAAGIGIAIAAIPYCFVRAISEFRAEGRRSEMDYVRQMRQEDDL